MPHDVFISYSSKDKAIADAVVAGLEIEGVRCWVAPRDLIPGVPWGKGICEAIENSRVLVVILSENSNHSKQVARELERAVANKVVVVPFRIQDVEPTGEIAFFISTEHWLDAITPPIENHIDKLRKVLQHFIDAQISPHVDINHLRTRKIKADSTPLPDPLQIQSEGYERRIVTILFADIANYSSLSETLDPEYLLDIMRKAYPCLIEPIQAHHGTVIQVMGDGILAYFGTPISREDDPERAVIAGLEIITRIKTYAGQLREKKDAEAFQIRVGINTGLVVVGDLNPDKHLEYIALGDAVNLAARLQQIAPPDGLLISHETYRHIQGLFDVIPQSPITVKGRQQITQTYLVKQIRPFEQRRRLRGISGVETPMVGREPEMAALQNHFQDAIIGAETALILIHGDAGIGKTRLSKAFVDWVALQPGAPLIFQGRAIPSTQSVPYGILRNLFAKIFEIMETDSSTQALTKFRQGTQNILDQEQSDLVGQLIGFDFRSSPAVQHIFGSSSFAETANLYLVNYFRRLASGSLLILLEDLHWMDDSTLDLITELVEKLSQEPEIRLMIVCTARPVFFERRENWGEGLPGFTRLKLSRLSRLRSRTLIAEILRNVEQIPEDLFACITNVAEGNPFFIEELIKMLIEGGVINTSQEAWQVRLEKLAKVQVPPTLTGILQARMDSLPAAEKLVLQRAAVIGRTFWDGLLCSLTVEKGEAQLINEHLSALRDRGLIFKHERSSIEGHQEYLFKHALVRDAAYETVLLKHRRAYHAQVATWIEVNSGERLEEHLALIASHYADGGQPDLAADWTLRAGERAASQCSMKEAKDLFEKALNMIRPDDIERRWRGTLGHSEALGVLGYIEERHVDDNALLDLAHQLNDQSRNAEAYYMIGNQAYREGNNAAARRAYEEALHAACTAGDLSLQAEILPMLVAILTAEGEFQSAGELVEQALEMAHQSGDANILARALNNLALYYQAIGDVPCAINLLHQQVEITQQQGNRLGESMGLSNLGYNYLSLGQFENGHKLLKQALYAAQQMEDRRSVAYIHLNLGLAEWRLGRHADACQSINDSLARLEQLGDRVGIAYGHYYLGLANEEAGDLPEAATHYENAQSAFKALGMAALAVEAQAGLARLSLQQEDLVQAQHIAIQVSSFFNKEGPQGFELPMLVYLTCAKIFEALKDTSQLKQTLEKSHEVIQARLEGIKESSWRKLFVEAIPEHRTLLALYTKKG
jgi:predicted ATPase/class 3 adenylate cyclase